MMGLVQKNEIGAGYSSRKPPKILVVDDDANTRQAIMAILEHLEVEVVEAESGEEALKKILRADFAMIILDVKMAGMSGFDTAYAIRQREKTKDIPIIFLSGMEKDEVQVSRGYDLGATDYMLKPIVPQSLVAKVRFTIMHHVQLLEALEEQKRLLAEQAEMLGELGRSNKALDDFAYVAAHDLREPLRGISINANFLLKEEVSETVRSRLCRMIELSIHMDNLISDLFLFSRLGQRSDPNLQIDVEQIISGCYRLIENLQNPDVAELNVKGPFPMVFAEPARIRTVFQNLISNGLQYNRSTPKIVEVGFEEVLVLGERTFRNVFYVRDNGIGISEEFHEKVFQIFTRLNSKKEFDSGSGAGLAFVKRILEGYGCSINFVSEAGVGTTFVFNLPLEPSVER